MEMINDIKVILKNAQKICKRDNYPQIVYKEKDNTYTITRLYTDLHIFNVKEVCAIVQCGWMGGIFHTKTISDEIKINDTLKIYNISIN